MEDVLRPRSIDSWAVIRAWFEQDDTWSVKGTKKAQYAWYMYTADSTALCCCADALQCIFC
jgi:hypothetical protein